MTIRHSTWGGDNTGRDQHNAKPDGANSTSNNWNGAPSNALIYG
jgi:hypothetical protein